MEKKLKVTVTSITDSENIEFPCLMISDMNTILLAKCYSSNTNKIEGMVIGGNNVSIGEYADDWNPEYWKPFHGKITLEQ